MQRRHFLRSAGLAVAALSSGAALARGDDAPVAANDASATPVPGKPGFAPAPPLAPIRASADRIVALSVCTRPFRAQGPRIETERVGRHAIVHHYGHGGSGWSLSWGSAALALQLVAAAQPRRGEVAVVGCGAIGLTTAVAAQRAGYRVRIYAKERLPEVRSFLATGVWSPASRICTTQYATPEFERRWEAMARLSFHTYQTLLGLPGEPIEWRDGYVLSDVPFGQPSGGGGEDEEPDYPNLEGRLLDDIGPRSVALSPSQHPFPVPYARRFTQMTYNISAYSRMLMADFERAGGRFETRAFESLRELAELDERVVVNCTGYGARALLGDDSIVPVRGQTARLVPQPEVTYGLVWRGHNLNTVPRRDGILVQAQAPGDFGNPDTTPDRAAAEAMVARLASLFPQG